MSLENPKILHHLIFSFNKLLVEVPKGKYFKNCVSTMFMGNLGLYGPWISLSLSFSHKHKSVSHLKMVIILVVAVTMTMVLFLFLMEMKLQEAYSR
jgi:hypothetical protein